MVARDIPPPDPLERAGLWLRTSAGMLLRRWRRVLGGPHARLRRAGAWVQAAARTWSSQWTAAWTYLRGPASAWSGQPQAAAPQAARTAAAVGARALIAGSLGAGALAMAGGETARGAAAALVVQVAWALGRLAVCRAVVPADALAPGRVAAVCLAGWLPYALALTGPLRVVAFGWSALLTYRGLGAAGLAPKRARAVVLWAFGGQVGVMMVAALVALVLLALGGA